MTGHKYTVEYTISFLKNIEQVKSAETSKYYFFLLLL